MVTGFASAAKLAGTVGAVVDGWNGFAVLHRLLPAWAVLISAASPRVSMRLKCHCRWTFFPVGADEMNFEAGTRSSPSTSVRMATRRAESPTSSCRPPLTRKPGTWVNTEGRVQIGNRAGFAPAISEDWAIIRALSDVLGKKLPFDR